MKHSFNQRTWVTACILVIAVVATAGLWGCFSTDDNPVATSDTQDTAPLMNASHAAMRSVMAIQNRHTRSLMADPEVIGTATTLLDGQPAIMVLVTTRRAEKAAPRSLDGVAVRVVLTDRIVAMKGKPPKPPPEPDVDHQAKQTPPILLGTSGGWRYDLANGYCCSGTLGALIDVDGQKRILSNYHVFEADIVDGGNERTAQTGDYIIQPGLIDIGCDANAAQNVATLVKSSSLPGSNVDCSSATIISGMVKEDGSILEVGTISASTVDAAVRQRVKKSGRTTGLTRSKVDGLNATVSVSYENECAGGTAFTKTFTGQILIVNRGSKFLGGGDSGSLMVEDVDTNPGAVGLLFAGSSTLAVANPIDDVLLFFNASMVGQ